MAGFVVRKITVFSIFFNHQTITLVTLNNVLECCHFFIHVRYIHIFFYFRIDGQSNVQFSEYAKSANLGGVPHPPNTPPPYGPASYEQNLSLSTAVLEIKFGKKLHALKTRCKQTRPVAHTMLCAQNMRRRDLTFTLILRSLYSSLWQNTSCIYHYCGW